MIKSILAVCIGNICRSPMAEGLLRAQLDGVKVESAGIAALDGRRAEPLATSLLADRGIDISEHRARTLTAWQCERADMIFVMDLEQKVAVESQYPFTRGRVFRIGEADDVDVPDPYRLGKEQFQVCLELIETGVNKWAQKIRKIN